jgi:hypothetical protein
MNGTFDAATWCGTVDYEVDGPYCVRKEGRVQNVHLYGVEYVSPSQSSLMNVGTTSTSNNHHENVNSYGWYETLNAIRDVARSLSITAPQVQKLELGYLPFVVICLSSHT